MSSFEIENKFEFNYYLFFVTFFDTNIK